MFERLDHDTRRVFVLAQQEARALDHHYVGTEHVLLALAVAGGAPADLLTARGCGPEVIRDEIGAVIGAGDRRNPPPEALLATLGIDLAAVRQRVEAAASNARAAATFPFLELGGQWCQIRDG